MANKRKQHLKYQAKKGRLQSESQSHDASVATQSVQTGDKQEKLIAQSTSVVENTAKVTNNTSSISKLPDTEVAFVRRELIYLVFVALVLLAFYLVIWLVFKYTSIDEYLYSLIKLKA